LTCTKVKQKENSLYKMTTKFAGLYLPVELCCKQAFYQFGFYLSSLLPIKLPASQPS